MASQNATTGTSTRRNNNNRGAQSGKSRQSAARGNAPAFAKHGSTREPDENYALVSVLYHALQGAETYSQYIRDAEAAGDDELVEFFGDVKEEEEERAERAKQLLAERLSGEDYEDED
jgi:hypothetical protein